ncbi:hypothetical protein C9975_10005, partial [Thalassospira xiamenensis]
KSDALNWADIARDKHGIRDAENAEDAQDLVSGAESAGWTLFSFATGGVGMGLGMGALFGEIEDNQTWWPTYIILVEPQNLSDSNAVLSLVEENLKPMFEKSNKLDYEGLVWRSQGRNWANAAILWSGSECKYVNPYEKNKNKVLNLPVGYDACYMDVMIKLSSKTKLDNGKVQDVITVEQRAYSNHALSLAAHFDGPTLFPVNYKVRVDGNDVALPFPFVLKESNALLFTGSNASLPLTIGN